MIDRAITWAAIVVLSLSFYSRPSVEFVALLAPMLIAEAHRTACFVDSAGFPTRSFGL